MLEFKEVYKWQKTAIIEEDSPAVTMSAKFDIVYMNTYDKYLLVVTLSGKDAPLKSPIAIALHDNWDDAIKKAEEIALFNFRLPSNDKYNISTH